MMKNSTPDDERIFRQLETMGYYDITRGVNTPTQLKWAMVHYLTAEVGLDYDEMAELNLEELLEKIIY